MREFLPVAEREMRQAWSAYCFGLPGLAQEEKVEGPFLHVALLHKFSLKQGDGSCTSREAVAT